MKRKTIAVVLALMVQFMQVKEGRSENIAPDGRSHPHPTGVTIPKDMKLPEHFKAGKGNILECVTCHTDSEIGRKKREEINKDTTDFLRGGPYGDISSFCFKCHREEEYQSPNIHKMIDGNGKANTERCGVCHETTPEPEKTKGMNEVKFRIPAEKLCYGCHLKSPHLNALDHMKKPAEKMKRTMANSEKEKGIILPLDGEGKVMCATCHATHEKGVIRETAPAGKQVEDHEVEKGVVYKKGGRWSDVYAEDKKERLKKMASEKGETFSLEYEEIEKEVLLRLPAKNGELCMACHEFER